MSMALVLATARRMGAGERLVRAGKWTRLEPDLDAGRAGCCGKRMGIVGMGRIGQALARRARGFGLSIHYHNRKRVHAEIETRARRDLLGEPRPDAGAHGHRLGELPAHAGDLSICCRRGG